MNEDEIMQSPPVKGQVKWFDPGKGFGFVVAEAGGPDILLHANVLRNFGQSSVADGSEVEVFVQETERGVQVVSIISVEPPTDVAVSVLDDIAGFDPGYLADLEILPARVKWFDKGKGFGFANIFGLADDVFIHIEVLRKSGLADLLPGEAVCLRVIDGKRGKMAAEVMPWDVAQKQKSDGD